MFVCLLDLDVDGLGAGLNESTVIIIIIDRYFDTRSVRVLELIINISLLASDACCAFIRFRDIPCDSGRGGRERHIGDESIPHRADSHDGNRYHISRIVGIIGVHYRSVRSCAD